MQVNRSIGGTVRTVLLTRQAVTVVAVAGMAVLGVSAPAIASSSARTGTHPATHATARPALPAGQHYVCPPARPGQETCMSIVRTSQAWSATAMSAARAAQAANG